MTRDKSCKSQLTLCMLIYKLDIFSLTLQILQMSENTFLYQLRISKAERTFSRLIRSTTSWNEFWRANYILFTTALHYGQWSPVEVGCDTYAQPADGDTVYESTNWVLKRHSLMGHGRTPSCFSVIIYLELDFTVNIKASRLQPLGRVNRAYQHQP